jgi:hypothetical protein
VRACVLRNKVVNIMFQQRYDIINTIITIVVIALRIKTECVRRSLCRVNDHVITGRGKNNTFRPALSLFFVFLFTEKKKNEKIIPLYYLFFEVICAQVFSLCVARI